MTTEEIQEYLRALSDELSKIGLKGEICLYSGAVMCLVYKARPSTKDVDAIFQPVAQMREAAKRVAEIYGLRPDWRNDAVSGYVVEHPQRILFDLPALKVFVPEPDYLLAMKTLVALFVLARAGSVLRMNGLLHQSASTVFILIS
jgi:hypothetical protein